jgi:hypothetical protein
MSKLRLITNGNVYPVSALYRRLIRKLSRSFEVELENTALPIS